MKRLTASTGMISEYCAQVVKIGELKPIEGSDFLAQVLVAGNTMVVRKDEIATGDLAIYCKNETELNEEFLSVNNLFEGAEYEKNANHEEYEKLKDEYNRLCMSDLSDEGRNKLDEIQSKLKGMCGFFNKYGRVKMIRLKGVASYGFIVKLDTLAKWIPEIKSENLEQYILNEEMGIGEDFDTICGKPFIKVYVPRIKERTRPKNDSTRRERKRNKKIERFERISDKDFSFHYDTKQLNDNIWRIEPNSKVFISNKLHGTSAIFANIPVKYPAKLSYCQRAWNWIHSKAVQLERWLNTKTTLTYYIDYGNVYASRNVIKNQTINQNVGPGFYGVDIYGVYNKLIKDYIEQGMTIYGEICGYVPGKDTMIQKGYDYGCKPGENFLMIYRITTQSQEDDTKREWEVDEVYEWTVNLIKEHPELEGKVQPITIFYQGTLHDLYPDVNIQENWHENILLKIKADKERFGMELNEPLCKNKVPREGLVIRIGGDSKSEAFKLKSDAYCEKDKKKMDKGEVDFEMAERYYDKENNEE